jgi:ketosteroid isomerase-like protein
MGNHDDFAQDARGAHDARPGGADSADDRCGQPARLRHHAALRRPEPGNDTTPSGFGVYEGTAAIREFVEGYWEMFDELSFELEEFVDLGNGVTLAVNRQRAVPRGSSADVQAREAQVTEWQDGLALRITVYIDTDEARAAAERLAGERG